MYDSNGNLTRAGAEQTIKDGGTVHLRGADGQVREYKTVAQLPSEAEFAIGDPTARQKALDGLAAQRRQLDEQEQKLLAAAKGEEQARKDADAAQRDREKAEAKNPQSPQTLHQQVGGRPLSGAENPLAADEANANAKAAQQRQQPQRTAGAAVGGGEEEEHFAGKPLSAYDGIADDQLTNEKGVGEATSHDIIKARKARDRKAAK